MLIFYNVQPCLQKNHVVYSFFSVWNVLAPQISRDTFINQSVKKKNKPFAGSAYNYYLED